MDRIMTGRSTLFLSPFNCNLSFIKDITIYRQNYYDNIVGAMVLNTSTGEICHLNVLKSYRRHGIGSFMVKNATLEIMYLKERGQAKTNKVFYISDKRNIFWDNQTGFTYKNGMYLSMFSDRRYDLWRDNAPFGLHMV